MKLIATLLLLTICSFTFAQKGEGTYEFLNLPNSSRVGALGGANITINDADINIAYNNPALLSDTLNNHLAFNYINYVSDINFGYFALAKHLENIGTFAFGIQNINYGEFTYYDETGYTDGTVFGAKEYAVSIQYGRQLYKNLRVGGSFKQVYSAFEKYTSYGVVLDAGLHYDLKKIGFSSAVVMRNFGTQITTYTDNNFERMPFEIIAGFSQKLLHAPFRFSVTARNLHDLDLTYENGVNYNNRRYGNFSEPEFKDKAVRHLIIGAEFIPSKNFYLAGGYNFMRRYELKVEEKASTVGFSWGFGLKIYKFHVSYGSAKYHLAGTSNHFSITTNLSAF